MNWSRHLFIWKKNIATKYRINAKCWPLNKFGKWNVEPIESMLYSSAAVHHHHFTTKKIVEISRCDDEFIQLIQLLLSLAALSLPLLFFCFFLFRLLCFIRCFIDSAVDWLPSVLLYEFSRETYSTHFFPVCCVHLFVFVCTSRARFINFSFSRLNSLPKTLFIVVAVVAAHSFRKYARVT